jgi:hypothetical protein
MTGGDILFTSPTTSARDGMGKDKELDPVVFYYFCHYTKHEQPITKTKGKVTIVK